MFDARASKETILLNKKKKRNMTSLPLHKSTATTVDINPKNGHGLRGPILSEGCRELQEIEFK